MFLFLPILTLGGIISYHYPVLLGMLLHLTWNSSWGCRLMVEYKALGSDPSTKKGKEMKQRQNFTCCRS